MTQQYLRSAAIVVSKDDGTGLDFAKFKCEFQVRRGDTQTPNSADVRIYNLNNDTANSLFQPEFSTLTIAAGYSGNAAQIFQGDIKQVRLGRVDQKDSYVDITAADGDRAYNFATVVLQLPTTTKPTMLTQIQSVIKAMKPFGVSEGYLPPLPQNCPVRGITHFGLARDSLRELAAQANCTWSIQDGKVNFVPLTAAIPSSSVPLISPATGLIGSPEQTANGIEMRTLLNPTYKIGQLVKLDQSVTVNGLRIGLDLNSQAITNTQIFGNTNDPTATQPIQGSGKINGDGLYYVMRADHSGDTRGQAWYTDLICLAVNASAPRDQNAFTYASPTAEYIRRY